MAVDQAQQQGEMQGGEDSHISYVKHLSADQNLPNQQGGSFIDKVPGGWWTIGIGAATVVIGILTLHKMSQNNANNLPSGSGAYYPYGTNSTSGNTPDNSNSVSGAMDQQLTGLMGQEQINNQVLQAILANLTHPGSTGPSTTPTPTPNPIPNPKPHGGGSHSWVYTTKKGDTLNSLNQFAHWGPLNSLNQSGNNVYKYNGNQSIFQKLGITNPNQSLPQGIKVKL